MDVPPPLPVPKKNSGLAVASLCLGVLAVLGGVLLILPTVLAVIFGHMALSRIRKDPQVGGRGLAIGGLVTGYGSLVSLFAIGLLAAMAIPAFEKVRENASTKTMLNNARMIAGAAQQCFLEDETRGAITIEIDPETGEVTGPLALYIPTLTKDIVAVDNVIENDEDGFSLRHPFVNGGEPVEFDSEGLPLQELGGSPARAGE